MTRKARPVALTPEEVRFRLDEWLDGKVTVVERSGPEWVCVCPRCSREKLAIHVGRKAWQCFSGHCRFKGWRPVVLVAAIAGVSTEEAAHIIAASVLGVDIGPVQALAEPASVRSPFKLPKASLPLVDWRLRPAQAEYLRRRGVPESHALWSRLGTIVSGGTDSKADRVLAGRIIFPVWDPRGRLVWWCARDIGDSRVKVINMPRSCREPSHGPHCCCYHEDWGLPPVPQAATADEVVMGLQGITPGHPAIVVEGPIDQVVCGPGFVSVQRSWVSPQQAALIAHMRPSEAVILFDGDTPDQKGRRAGEDGLAKSLPILRAALPTRGTVCPEGTDPGSLGRARSLQAALAAPVGEAIQQLSGPRYTRIGQPGSPAPVQAPLTNQPLRSGPKSAE